jgi:hypothetical protein
MVVGSNPTRGEGWIIVHVSSDCTSCVGKALLRADPTSKESYEITKRFVHTRKLILNWNRLVGVIRAGLAQPV